MHEFSDFYFTSSTGKNRIRVKLCTPGSEPKAVIQISHGIAEHIDRYEEFMAFLADNGFVVAGDDHLGHGKSICAPEEQGFFAENDGWTFAVNDMKKLHDYMAEKYPDIPYVFFGHSMGSFLTRTYIIKYPSDYTAVIISGTGMQASAMSEAGYLMAKTATAIYGPHKIGNKLNDIAFGSYCKGIESPRTPNDWLSRDPAEVDKYTNDPLCGFVPTVSVFRDMMGGIKFVSDSKNIAKMNKKAPVLFMSGEKDPVGEYGKGVERAYKAFCDAGQEDVFLKLYKDGRHEMLNEINKHEVFSDILSWINSKI